MKKKYFIVIFAVILYCCKEDNELNNNKMPDNIVYKDCGENVFISTIRFIEDNHFSSCSGIPVPEDSLSELFFDIDRDGINDFKIEASHSKSEDCFSGTCGYGFNYTIKINGINMGDSIRVYANSIVGPNPEKLDSTMDIAQNGIWRREAYFLVIWSCHVSSVNSAPFTEMIIGIRKGNKFGWLHVKPKEGNGIYLLEHAINMTDNNSIFTGQKQ